jgi:hypothetical protein
MVWVRLKAVDDVEEVWAIGQQQDVQSQREASEEGEE